MIARAVEVVERSLLPVAPARPHVCLNRESQGMYTNNFFKFNR